MAGNPICSVGISDLHYSKTVSKDTICGSDASEEWAGTWSTAPQLVGPRNMPPEPGLSNNTVNRVF